MHLMKLFNLNYFYQNIKKSASTLALFLGIIPLLNVIIFLLLANANPHGYAVTLDSLSILLLIGMYIIPVVLASSLYSFMFKRKSIDFIGSMPISKKSIYVTNTIGGCFIIFCVLLVTVFLTGIIAFFLGNVYITPSILVDLFLVFLIAYLFVYSAVTLAFSLSRNMITGLLVTLLFLFFIPFVCYYKDSLVNYRGSISYIKCTSETCMPTTYTCNEYSYECARHKKEGEYQFYLYRNYQDTYYPLPVSAIFQLLGMQEGDVFVAFDFKELGITLFITFVYFVIGYLIYKKRKLEICETSFYHFYIHLFVKALTMLPIFTVIYEIGRYESIYATVFVLLLLLVYYFVYDLITRKHIEQIKKSIFSFGITLGVLLLYCFFMHQLPKKDAPVFHNEDIKKMTVTLYNPKKQVEETYEVKEQENINNIVKYMISQKEHHDYNVEVKFTDGTDTYATNILLEEEEYIDFLTFLPSVKKIEAKNIDDAYALSIYGNFINEDIAWYKQEVMNTLKKEKELPTTCYTDASLLFYRYIHHKVEKIRVPACISTEIEKKIMEDKNHNVLTYFDHAHYVPYADLITNVDGITNEEVYFLTEYYGEEFFKFLFEHLNENVALNDNLIEFYLGQYKDQDLRVYLNAKSEFIEFIDTLREKVKDTEEYQQYMDSLRGEARE